MNRNNLIVVFFSLILATLLSNCSDVKYGTKFSGNTFNNVAVINSDSCKQWNLPKTSFMIEYPEQFKAEYNADSRYYLRLRRFQKEQVVQEITIGKSENIDNEESAKYWLQYTDSLLNNQLEYYNREYIGLDSINNQPYLTLASSLSFDQYGSSMFRGIYDSKSLIVFPPNNRTQGLVVSFLKHSSLQEEKNVPQSSNEQLWDTFSFIR